MEFHVNISNHNKKMFRTHSPMHAVSFPRIDFDDILVEELKDRKPAWNQLQEKIKSSYRRPKQTVEKNRELNETQDLYLGQAYKKKQAYLQLPFTQLNNKNFISRTPSWVADEAINKLNPARSSFYAAPALSTSKGLEKQNVNASRYDCLVDNIEAKLLKMSILPKSMKIVTHKEFRKAPLSGAGSLTEDLITNDKLGILFPKPYYSRPNRDDPNYFDFDLQHSIDLYRKPEGQYIPRGPQPWENKLLSEVMSKGDAPIAAYMFTKGMPFMSNSGTTALPPLISQRDWRSTNTSYLSAALRTPAFWEHRFASIGLQIRDSNPVSMDSLLRNKPVPNKFTEYRDPDFEYYEDPQSPG